MAGQSFIFDEDMRDEFRANSPRKGDVKKVSILGNGQPPFAWFVLIGDDPLAEGAWLRALPELGLDGKITEDVLPSSVPLLDATTGYIREANIPLDVARLVGPGAELPMSAMPPQVYHAVMPFDVKHLVKTEDEWTMQDAAWVTINDLIDPAVTPNTACEFDIRIWYDAEDGCGANFTVIGPNKYHLSYNKRQSLDATTVQEDNCHDWHQPTSPTASSLYPHSWCHIHGMVLPLNYGDLRVQFRTAVAGKIVMVLKGSYMKTNQYYLG